MKGKKPLGAPVCAPWIQALGATLVVSGLPQMYSQLQTGIADGVILIATGAWPLKIHEVAPFITEVDTGPLTFGGSAMNAASFAKMPPEVQKVLRELGREYSTENARLIGIRLDAAMKGMAAAGAKTSKMSEANRKNGPTASRRSASSGSRISRSGEFKPNRSLPIHEYGARSRRQAAARLGQLRLNRADRLQDFLPVAVPAGRVTGRGIEGFAPGWNS